MTLGSLAERIAGRVQPEHAHTLITGVASAGDAGPGHITFFGNPKYLKQTQSTRASAVLVPLDFKHPLDHAIPVYVDNPSEAFALVVAEFAPRAEAPQAGIHPSAVVAHDAVIDPTASIGPCAVIESKARVGARTVVGAGCFLGSGSSLGEDCLLYPRVCVREHCLIGNRVIIHCGAVIGSDGYGFEFKDGRHLKIPQVGIVQIDDDVEIGANTTIDRARFGRTWVQEGVKIDNLVQIAHNVVVGRHSLLVAQVGIAGSTRLGCYVTLAGQVGVAGHAEIGDRVVAGAQSGIPGDLPPGAKVFGCPSQPMNEAKRQIAALHRLPDALREIRDLRQRLEALEESARKSANTPVATAAEKTP